MSATHNNFPDAEVIATRTEYDYAHAPDWFATGGYIQGWRTHELVILPLAAGAVAGQRVPGVDGKVAETGSLGEASHSSRQRDRRRVASGTVTWTTVTLPPGRYELICNLPNHYADGMYQQLVVT